MPVNADTRISESFARALQGFDQPRLGVAVSGGGDSVAMLRLAQIWASGRGVALYVYCVDHGLRAEAADEAAFVAALCESLGVRVRVLKWQGWDGKGNLSARARAARYDLIASAARADDVPAVLLAHTRDDQAETVLMSLARRSGVDGLSGMPVIRQDRGISWLRPLLGTARAELRDYLGGLGQSWCDDPGNEDTTHERIRMRKAQPMLNSLGLTTAALADVAANMQAVRDALEAAKADGLKRHAQSVQGAVKLAAGFLTEPRELQRRILIHCLSWVAPSASPSRGDAQQRTLALMAQGQDTTLQGCLVQRKGDGFWILREPGAVAGITALVGETWDSRWIVSGPANSGQFHIAPLTEAGLSECQNWRDSGLPRAFFLSSPAIWQEQRLIAAPIAGYGHGWSADLVRSDADFHNAAMRR